MLIWSSLFVSFAALFGLFALESIGTGAEPIARAAFVPFICLALVTSMGTYWTEKRVHHHIH